MSTKLVNPLDFTDEEYYRHKRDMTIAYEQWFNDICNDLWQEFYQNKRAMTYGGWDNSPRCETMTPKQRRSDDE